MKMYCEFATITRHDTLHQIQYSMSEPNISKWTVVGGFLYAMYCLVLMLSSFLVCTHIGETGKDKRRDNVHFSSFWFTIDFLLFCQNIDGVYWVWGRLIFQRAQAPAVNYPKASVPRAPLHSRIWTCKLNNRVGVSIWFSPLHLYVSMKARLVVIRVQPCIGVSMKARFVVIRVQPCLT